MLRYSAFKLIVPPVLVLLGVCLALEAYVVLTQVPPYLLPRPSTVLQTLRSEATPLMAALWTTTQAALAGFSASVVFGILVAIALSASTFARRAIYPYTVFFQTVPIVAIAPLLIFWFDAGFQSVAICAFVVSAFPVIANALSGLRLTDPPLVDLFRLYGARRIDLLLKLRLPAAIPSLMNGLRVAAGLAVIGTVVAEFLVGRIDNDAGLGVIIASAARNGRPDRVFAAVILTSVLGLLLFAAVNLTSYLLLRRWHASEKTPA